jgi:hypothetical protein
VAGVQGECAGSSISRGLDLYLAIAQRASEHLNIVDISGKSWPFTFQLSAGPPRYLPWGMGMAVMRARSDVA